MVAKLFLYLQIKSLFSRLASKDRDDSRTEQDLIEDYDNMEAETVVQEAFEAAINVQKNKRKK